jgi:hypothetical protein
MRWWVALVSVLAVVLLFGTLLRALLWLILIAAAFAGGTYIVRRRNPHV